MSRPTRPLFAKELRVSYATLEPRIPVHARQIKTAADAAAILVPLLKDQPQELFVALHLSTKLHLLGVQEVARGSLADVAVPIRMIVAAALAANAAAVCLAHCHPSGDPEPSPDDLVLTHRIVEACRLFDVTVVDHIVVAADRYLSFKETGRLRK